MNHQRHNYTVNLKGVRSKAQMRLERLRRDARSTPERNVVPAPEIQSRDVVGESLRVLGVVVIILCSWTYVPSISASLSYFMDTEGTPSQLASGYIDLFASTSPETIELECVGVEDRWVHVESTGNEANITASMVGMTSSSTLCKAIELEVLQFGNTIYDGLLQDFQVENIESGDVRFLMRLKDDAGPFEEGGETCTSSIEFLAVQERHGGEVGFSDSEVIELAFSTDEATCGDDCEEPCDDDCCCGDLYVDVTNINDGTVINNIDVNVGTGGNEANGDGGIIETGDADASVTIETILNTNETVVEQNCGCGCCDDGCDTCESSCDSASECGEVQEVVVENTNIDEAEEAEESAEEGAVEDVIEEEGEEPETTIETSADEEPTSTETDEVDISQMIEDKKEEMLSGFDFPNL